jgi:hypothetical protein
MAVTMEQVRAALDADEPDYPAAARHYGPEAAPLLAQLVREADPLLASKAAYLASLLGDAAANVVAAAAEHVDPVVRVASAAAAGNLSAKAAEPALDTLLDDPDVGVRKAALRATGPDATALVKDHVVSRARSETDPVLRPQIESALARLAGPAARGGPPVTGEAGDERDDGRGFGGGDLGDALGAYAQPHVVEGHGGGELGSVSGPSAIPGHEDDGANGGGQIDGGSDANGGGQGGGDLGGGDLGDGTSSGHDDRAGTGGGEVPTA